MKRSPVTLRDIAREVGVHTSTVSRILNPETRHKYAPEMAERVSLAAQKMGYRPNPIAYGLKTNRSMTVGVIIPDLTNPVFPPIIRGIENTLSEAGITTLLGDSDNNPDRQRTILSRMKSRWVDGIILASAKLKDDLVTECRKDGTPVVLINRTTNQENVLSVVNDDCLGIKLAVRHMKQLGHRRIAHVAGPLEYSTGYDRYQGFLEAMKQEGLEPNPALIGYSLAYSEEAGQQAFEPLLASGEPFTGVIAANDLIAMGVYNALQNRGIRCPEDISVSGFNDMPFVNKLRPPLTTLRIQHYEMGARAAQLLLRQMRNEENEELLVHLKPELIVRGSTAQAAKG